MLGKLYPEKQLYRIDHYLVRLWLHFVVTISRAYRINRYL